MSGGTVPFLRPVRRGQEGRFGAAAAARGTPVQPARSWEQPTPKEPLGGAAAFLVLSVFLACCVEAVEALTVILATGVTRGWRASLYGAGAGVAALAVIVAVLGPAVTQVPLNALRVVVGGLLLVFGLGWLRKAVLRAAGLKALHDEAAIYDRQVAASTAAGGKPASGLDRYAFTLSFKAVLLEGLEVVFIVLTFGANQGDIGLAAVGGIAAVALVSAVGFAVRAPLTRVPENTLKFVVGVMLTSFGVFWAGEGVGVDWPGADAALLALIAVIGLASVGLARAARPDRGDLVAAR